MWSGFSLQWIRSGELSVDCCLESMFVSSCCCCCCCGYDDDRSEMSWTCNAFPAVLIESGGSLQVSQCFFFFSLYTNLIGSSRGLLVPV
jgi:hypothetical protein